MSVNHLGPERLAERGDQAELPMNPFAYFSLFNQVVSEMTIMKLKLIRTIRNLTSTRHCCLVNEGVSLKVGLA